MLIVGFKDLNGMSDSKSLKRSPTRSGDEGDRDFDREKRTKIETKETGEFYYFYSDKNGDKVGDRV